MFLHDVDAGKEHVVGGIFEFGETQGQEAPAEPQNVLVHCSSHHRRRRFDLVGGDRGPR